MGIKREEVRSMRTRVNEWVCARGGNVLEV